MLTRKIVVQPLDRHHCRATETPTSLVAIALGLHRILRVNRLRFCLELAESGQDVPPGQRDESFL